MNSSQTMRSAFHLPTLWTGVIGLVLIGISAWNPSSASAQDSYTLRATYGRGVHAYFAGQFNQAEQLFSQVVCAGSTDPRVYYFRAMALLRLERQFEAENDMRIGANFEARNAGGRLSISKALQRVQGPGRRTLERFRRQSRLEHAQMIRTQTQKRYQQLERRNETVLHKETPTEGEVFVENPTTPADKTTRPATGDTDPDMFGDTAPTPVVPEGADPFGESNETEDSGSTPVEGAVQPEKEDNLFGEGEDTTTPDAGNPFGFEEATGGEESEEPSKEGEPIEEDPFGKSPAEDDFFGAEEAFAETPNNSPAAGNSPAGGLNSAQVFFELGRWIGSQQSGQNQPNGPPEGAVLGEFELGPNNDDRMVPAPAGEADDEFSFESPEDNADPGGDASSETDDPFEEGSSSDTASDEDDPFSGF